MEVAFDLQDDLSWRTLRLPGGALCKLERASLIHYKEVLEQVSVMVEVPDFGLTHCYDYSSFQEEHLLVDDTEVAEDNLDSVVVDFDLAEGEVVVEYASWQIFRRLHLIQELEATVEASASADGFVEANWNVMN